MQRRACHLGSGAGVKGPATQPKLIDTDKQAHCCGVKFRIGGFSALFGTPIHELRNKIVNMATIFGTGSKSLRQDLLAAQKDMEKLDILEAFICAHMQADPEIDPHFASALAEIQKVMIYKYVERCHNSDHT